MSFIILLLLTKLSSILCLLSLLPALCSCWAASGCVYLWFALELNQEDQHHCFLRGLGHGTSYGWDI